MRPDCKKHALEIVPMDVSVVYVDLITYKCPRCAAMAQVRRAGTDPFAFDPKFITYCQSAARQALGPLKEVA